MVTCLAFAVDVAEFQWDLVALILAVGVLAFPSNAIKFPPVASLTRCVSFFCDKKDSRS